MGGDGSHFVQRPGLWSFFARGCLSQASSGHSRCWGGGLHEVQQIRGACAPFKALADALL